MASALLAMEQFNNRDASVVPELADLDECNIKFDMNNSLVMDTGRAVVFRNLIVACIIVVAHK